MASCKDCGHYAVCWHRIEVDSGNYLLGGNKLCNNFVEKNEENINAALYKAFRKELDEYAVPLILDEVDTVEVCAEGKQVGILCVVNGYIDCLYVMPEYRKRGYGKRAVMKYIKEHGCPEQLHIINNNIPALEFWNSIFELQEKDKNAVDTLYRIKGVKT